MTAAQQHFALLMLHTGWLTGALSDQDTQAEVVYQIRSGRLDPEYLVALRSHLNDILERSGHVNRSR